VASGLLPKVGARVDFLVARVGAVTSEQATAREGIVGALQDMPTKGKRRP